MTNDDPNEDGDIFYNLNFVENTLTGEVDSNIFKYYPSTIWLGDKSQPFSGQMEIVGNEYFTIGDIRATSAGRCITGISALWFCDFKNNHYEGHPECESGTSWELQYSLTYGPCPDPNTVEIDAGDSSGGGGSTGGGTTGGNQTETIVLVPCDENGGFGGANNSDCTPVEDYFNPYLCSSLTQQQEDWIFDNSENTDAAEEILLFLDNTSQNGCVEIDFEEKVIFDDSFTNNPKIKCAYDRLKEAGGLRQLMDNFFEEDEDVILNFKVTPNLNCSSSSHPNGCTRATYTGDNLKAVTIEISEQYINNFTFSGTTRPTPMLFLAKTLLHESIHANLYYALDQITNGNSNIPNDLEFEILYELYRDAKNWQHNTMANHYLDEIVQGLEDVHPLLGDQTFITNHSHYNWNDFYRNISWAGLTNTTAGENYLNDQSNFNDYQIYNLDALTDSTENQNCQ